MVLSHVLFLIELKVMEGSLKQPACHARALRFELDERLPAHRRYFLKVLDRQVRLIGTHFVNLEMTACFLNQRDELRAIPGVRGIRSNTSRGAAEIWVAFDWGEDMISALLQAESQVNRILPSLPAGTSFDVRRMTIACEALSAHTMSCVWHSGREMSSVSLRQSRGKHFARAQTVPPAACWSASRPLAVLFWPVVLEERAK